MYPNLEAELSRIGVKKNKLAEIWNCRVATVYDKLNGKSPITVEEMVLVKKHLFPYLTIDYLVRKEFSDET